MLSKEEKKSIELLEDYLICGNKEGVLYRNLRIILRIIEKQSKEIEHQIEKRANQRQELAILNAKQVEFNKLVNTVNSYKGQFKRQQKEIEENKKYLVNLTHEQYIKLVEQIRSEISKEWVDKIKAKIEEVKDGTFDAEIVLRSLLEKE